MRMTTRWLLALLVLVLAPTAFAQAPEPVAPQPLRVHFVDVGQGDGVVIQSPSGQTVVYDGGQDPTRMQEYLTALGVTEITLVIASHNHADHIGGLEEVIRAYRPLFYMDSGIPATTLTYGRVVAAVTEAGSQLLEPTTRRIALGEVSLVVVPPPGIAAWDQNDNSIGIIVEYGSFRLSLMGDAEEREWSWWMTNYSESLAPVHIHKASHHGSINGDTAAGIARLSPAMVVVSAGQDNQYGHPDPETLQLYAQQGATVYRTDLNGTVLVEAASSGSYTVTPEWETGARPPPATVPVPAPAPSPVPEPTPTPTPTPTPEPVPTPPQAACVNINTAGSIDLQRIIHIGPERAGQIISLRGVRPFSSVSELTRVSGIATARLRDIVAQGLACVR